MLAYIDWNVSPQIFKTSGFELRWYSLLFAAGFLVGYYILSWVFKKEQVKQEFLDKLTLYVILATIIGARVGHCLFYEPEVYLTNPLKMILPFETEGGFRFTGFQGLASHGGAIGIVTGLWLYCRKFKLPYMWVIDRLAIPTAFAAFCIRMGNLFNSEIYGVETSLPWGFRFLLENKYQGIPIDAIVPKHPTQIYEALAYILVFALLVIIYKKKGNNIKQGTYIGWFLTLVFLARFFIEFVKEDQEAFEASMTLNMGQLLSIPFIIAGVFLLIRKSVPAVLPKMKEKKKA